MKPALIVTHIEDRATGLVGECLAATGCAFVEVNSADGPAALPSVSELGGIVALGGSQSATAVSGDPFLEAEVKLMRAALADPLPVLGMCLGAQLLAVAAGGTVGPMGGMYVGWPELSLLPAAAEDPLFSALPSALRVLKWHEDMIIGPPGDVVLGGTGAATPGTGLFRVGPVAWGSQAHLEADVPMLEAWLDDEGGGAQVQRAGHDLAQFRAQSARLLAIQMAAARPVFARFAESVAAQRLWQTDSMLLPSGSSANAA